MTRAYKIPKYYYHPETIKKFYKYVYNCDFRSLTLERCKEIEQIADSHRLFFVANSDSLKTLMSFTCEKLIVNAKSFSLANKDEIAYFYIRIIDPTFLFLEAHQWACKDGEAKKLCFSKFHLYDANLIRLEKRFNTALLLFSDDELWSRGSFSR